jgi:hypothetical protein
MMLHDDDDAMSFLSHDVDSVPAQAFHLTNMPPFPQTPWYVVDDNSTIASIDLFVSHDTHAFDLTHMDVQSASWQRFAHIPIVESVLYQSTLYCVVEPVGPSDLVLYTERLPTFRPVKCVLDLFLVEPLDPTPTSAPSTIEPHPKTHAFFTSWYEGSIISSGTRLNINANPETNPETKNENETQNDNDKSLHNDTSEKDLYLESLQFPDHMLEYCLSF